MADRSLHEIALARLEGATQPEDEWSALVRAALEGPEALETLLDPSASAATPAATH